MIHLCNNYISSKVHSELIRCLSGYGEEQYVLVPVRRESDLLKNHIDCERLKIDYFLYENSFVRFFPLLKVFYVFIKSYFYLKAEVVKRKSEGGVCCLAHNFWSDGMVLFIFSFLCNIRYALVIRNTDINIFISRLPHYRWLMKWAIKRSTGLIFVSEAHHRRFAKQWPELLSKAPLVTVIPNGTHDFWHSKKVKITKERPAKACFVGRFDKNKNLVRTLQAAERIATDLSDFRLVLVGGEGSELRELLGVKKLPSFVEVLGTINEKEELATIYRSCRVFVMPSLRETFGLVYLEALTQGCAVICTKNEGIDGFFDTSDVVPVDPLSVVEIEQGVRKLIKSNSMGLDPIWVGCAVQPFQWDYIAKQYLAVYQ